MLTRAFAIAALALLPVGAEAGGCSLTAWSTDESPAGLAVRAGPGGAAPVVGNLPAPDTVPGATYVYRVVMTVTGSRNGWFRISLAEFPDYGYGDENPRVVFRGDGWVPGDVLGFRVQDPTVRSAPSVEAPTIDRAREDRAETIRVRRALSCTGEWFEVDALITYGPDRPGGRPVRGFVTDICSAEQDYCT